MKGSYYLICIKVTKIDKGIILIEDMTKEELEELRAGKIVYGFETQEEADKARISEELLDDEVEFEKIKNSKTTLIDVLNFHKNMTSWAIYRTNVEPVKGNEFAYLVPSKYNGLSYIGYNSSNYYENYIIIEFKILKYYF